MIHQLKITPKYFDDVVAGIKTFEVRKNDRNFHVGDFLALNEITPHECNAKHEHLETGRSVLMHVHYILDDPAYVKEGYVIMEIEACGVDLLGIACEPTILEEGV